MGEQWHDLLANLAVTTLCVVAWTQTQVWLDRWSPRWNQLVLGLLMGLGAGTTMLLPVQLTPGVLIDLRTSLIAIAALFGGPLSAAIAAGMASAMRIWIGGAGTPVGLATIVMAATAGLALAALTGREGPRFRHVGLLAAATGAISSWALGALGAIPGTEDIARFEIPFVLLSIAATGLGGLALLREKRVTAERDLFRAAMLQSPDFHYIKDRDSRFVAVNAAAAAHHGFADPDAMRGLTDLDLEPPERGEELMAAERTIIDTGIALLDHTERLVDGTGKERWYLTSKVPLIGHEGDIVGLAGVTRDITQRKVMERELIESRNLLSFALTEMSDGLAMFDAVGTLIMANERYRRMFPLTAELRLPGVHLGTILRAAVERGEQVGIDADEREDWIAATIAGLRQPVEQDVQLLDGRWLLVRNRPTAIGTTMVVVSDITTLKQSEAALKLMTEQLKLLASTDGLTGLLNRRSFDLAIERELATAARAGTPLSLLMIDVDHFKAFNDRYGHPAGDSCLRQAAHALRSAAVRPGDICARYGGEEFAVILPGTDAAGAHFVAERIRTSIENLRITHAASPQGIATVSIGLATADPGAGLAEDELIVAADAALYAAKAAGRNRIAAAPSARRGRPASAWLPSPTGT